MGDSNFLPIQHSYSYVTDEQPPENLAEFYNFYLRFLLFCDIGYYKIIENNLIHKRRKINMKKARSARRINKIGTTTDTITGRGGLALFSRYLEMTGILDILNSKFGSPYKTVRVNNFNKLHVTASDST